jgi:hypothetical protein
MIAHRPRREPAPRAWGQFGPGAVPLGGVAAVTEPWVQLGTAFKGVSSRWSAISRDPPTIPTPALMGGCGSIRTRVLAPVPDLP